MKTERLTKREIQCLEFAAKDKTLRETATALCLSYDTIKSHRRSLLRKLDCQTIAGALMKASRSFTTSFIESLREEKTIT